MACLTTRIYMRYYKIKIRLVAYFLWFHTICDDDYISSTTPIFQKIENLNIEIKLQHQRLMAIFQFFWWNY